MSAKIPIHNYLKSKSRQKWITVVVFETEPQESPRTSKECKDLAKFTCSGDAWIYAMNLAKSPGFYYDAWGIVVR